MADITLEAEYGGYSIRWVDFNRTLELYLDGEKVKGDIRTLQDCKEWIDGKNKQRYKRVSILFMARWRGSRGPGEATSLIDDDYVWIVGADKVRAKLQIKDCWLDTPRNRHVAEQIKDLEAKNKQIDREIKNLEDATERLTADMMLERK